MQPPLIKICAAWIDYQGIEFGELSNMVEKLYNSVFKKNTGNNTQVKITCCEYVGTIFDKLSKY